MVEFAQVPLPDCPAGVTADALADSIGTWITSPAMRALVAEHRAELPQLSTADLLAWLEEFSARHWDFRDGRVERDEVGAVGFGPSHSALVTAAARALGLSTAQAPRQEGYDHLLILGGLARACLQRTWFSAGLVRRGTRIGEIAALGSFRELRQPETDLLATLGITDCGYEVDAMEIGVRRGFDFAEPTEVRSSTGEVTHLSWSVRRYHSAGEPTVTVLAAPSSAPQSRRANTSDTYRFWAEQVSLAASDRVLVVTSPIYVPFQHCDAIRSIALPYGCGIETVGFDVNEALPELHQTPGPDKYLQEIRSAVRSMDALYRAL